MSVFAIVILVVALLLFGLGFAFKILWWLAVIAVIVFAVDFFLSRNRTPHD